MGTNFHIDWDKVWSSMGRAIVTQDIGGKGMSWSEDVESRLERLEKVVEGRQGKDRLDRWTADRAEEIIKDSARKNRVLSVEVEELKQALSEKRGEASRLREKVRELEEELEADFDREDRDAVEFLKEQLQVPDSVVCEDLASFACWIRRIVEDAKDSASKGRSAANHMESRLAECQRKLDSVQIQVDLEHNNFLRSAGMLDRETVKADIMREALMEILKLPCDLASCDESPCPVCIARRALRRVG